MMWALTWLHIAGGIVALMAGTVAAGSRKGSWLHASSGTWFAVSMLVLGVTAAILAQSEKDSGMAIGGIFTCYFVLTAWVTARRRDGGTGIFEMFACASAIGAAALLLWGGLTVVESPTPVGNGPMFALAFICLLAGIGDLNVVLRKVMTPAQRLSRHLWRMCFAFFIATGSFFMGQQDVMPQAVRGSPVLFILAFAPFAVMLFWLARLRFAKSLARLRVRMPAAVAGQPAGLPSA